MAEMVLAAFGAKTLMILESRTLTTLAVQEMLMAKEKQPAQKAE